MLLVYVDDILTAALTFKEVSWFNKTLYKRFNSKDLKRVSKVLSIRITRNRRNIAIYFDQEQYLDSVLKRFSITQGKHKKKCILLTDYSQLRPTQSDDERTDITEY